MSDMNDQEHHVRIRLQNCEAGSAVLHSESAARWALRHVAFNNGFEVHAHRAQPWAAPAPRVGNATSLFGLHMAMHDGEFDLLVDPAYRSIELHVVLGRDARHLRRNIAQLVDEFAAVCHAGSISVEVLHDKLSPPGRRPAEPLGALIASA